MVTLSSCKKMDDQIYESVHTRPKSTILFTKDLQSKSVILDLLLIYCTVDDWQTQCSKWGESAKTPWRVNSSPRRGAFQVRKLSEWTLLQMRETCFHDTLGLQVREWLQKSFHYGRGVAAGHSEKVIPERRKRHPVSFFLGRWTCDAAPAIQEHNWETLYAQLRKFSTPRHLLKDHQRFC